MSRSARNATAATPIPAIPQRTPMFARSTEPGQPPIMSRTWYLFWEELIQAIEGVGGVVNGIRALVLETDGVVNGSQILLNLTAGSNITLTDDGAGGVTITAASPLTKVTTSFSAATTVTITHNLGTNNLTLTVWDSTGEEILPESSVFTSVNVLTLTFGAAQTGTAVVIG